MVSRPTRGTTFRVTACSATRRTVQRAVPGGGALHTIAMMRCLSEGANTSAAPGRGASNTARAIPPVRYRWAILRTANGVSRTASATRGALSPRPNCNNAMARTTTRTCCTPPRSSASKARRSCARNRNGNGGRGMPTVYGTRILARKTM